MDQMHQSAQGYVVNIIILKRNQRAAFNIVMTSCLILMTKGTFLTECSSFVSFDDKNLLTFCHFELMEVIVMSKQKLTVDPSHIIRGQFQS